MKRRQVWKPEKEKPECLVSALNESWCLPAMSQPKVIKNPIYKDYFTHFPLNLDTFKGNQLIDLYFKDIISATQNNDYEISIKKSRKPKFITVKDIINGEKLVNSNIYNKQVAYFFVKYTNNPLISPRTHNSRYYSPFTMEKAVYLATQFEDIKYTFVPGSPIVVRTYLFDGQEIITEMIDWIPQDCTSEFQGKKHFWNVPNIAFEMPRSNPNLSLVVTLSHPLHNNHGDAFINYYQKYNESTLKSAKKQIIDLWSIQNTVLETFAWTIARVTDILSAQGAFTFPNPVPIGSQPDKDTIMKNLQEFEKRNQLNLKITIKAKLIHKSKEIAGYKIAKSLSFKETTPSYQFRHNIIFTLNELRITKSFENVIAKISLFNKRLNKKLPAFTAPYSSERSTSAITRLHTQKFRSSSLVFFNERFSFELPAKISTDLAIQMELFNIRVNHPNQFNSIDTIIISFDDPRVYIDSIYELGLNPKRSLFPRLRIAELTLKSNFSEGISLLDSIINDHNFKICYSYAMEFGLPQDFKQTMVNLVNFMPESSYTIWFVLELALKDTIRPDSRIEVLNLIDKLTEMKKIDHIARFTNCLLGLGFVSAANEIVYRVYQKLVEMKSDSNLFYINLLTPRHICESFLCTDYSILTFSLVCQSKDLRVFERLLICFSEIPDKLTKEILKRMMPPLSFLFPIKNCPFVMFFLENVTEEMFNEWWPKVNHKDVLSSMFFDEQRYQLSGLTFYDKCLSPGNISLISQSIFDLIPNLVANNFQLVFNIIKKMTEMKKFYKKCQPNLAVFFSRIFMFCAAYNDGYKLFSSLYDGDKKFHNSVSRSRSILTYSIYLADQKYLKNVSYLNKDETKALYQRVLNYKHLKNDLYEQSKVIKHSPDAFVDLMLKLSENYHKDDMFSEEIQTKIYVVAYIVEHMIYLHKIQDIFNTNHPFANVCPSSANIVPSGKICSGIFTDFFTNEFLQKLVKQTIDVCLESKYYEYGTSFVDDVVPLCQFLFNSFFNKEKEMMIEKLHNVEKRYFGNYFRVSFIGKKFCHENGLVFVVHFPKLARLLDVCKYYTNYCKERFGDKTKVEVVQSISQITDEMKSDKENVYFCVTFIEPYHKNRENSSGFESFHFVNNFYFERPFTISGNAQGTVETQWLERTVLSTSDKMPSVSMRSLVVREKSVKMPPIRVAYRQLHQRVINLDNTINSGAYETLQTLLSGNIMISVNEGVVRIAEVFLSSPTAEDYENHVILKYRVKLKNVFEDFLEKNREGLEKHKNYAEEHQNFMPLHNELSTKFEQLEKTLSQYLS